MPSLISGLLSGFVLDVPDMWGFRTSLHDPLPIAHNAVISLLSWIILGHGVPVASNEGLKSLIHHCGCVRLVFPRPPSHLWGVFADGEILPSLPVVGLSHGSSVHSSPLLWSQLRSHVVCPVGQLDPVTLFPTNANSGVPQRWTVVDS